MNGSSKPIQKIYSLIELIHYVFTIPGVKYFLSEKICQDPFWAAKIKRRHK
jgi:hypothetical protein